MRDDLLARHRAALPRWLAMYHEPPLELVRGQGRTVWDADGTEYLDFFGGILTTIVGHSIPELNEAVHAQLDRIWHTSTLYLIRNQVELAEELVSLVPIPDAKAFFVNSGSEANEAALLMACCARSSTQVLAVRNSYHGRTFGAMAVTGNRFWSASAATPLHVTYVHGGYRYRSPFRGLDDAGYVDACTDDLRQLLDMSTTGPVAAMIAEPIQGVGGFAVAPPGMFSAFRKVLDESGILLIADEVQTGLGRTGETFWGIEADGVVPDLMTMAKGLGNGLAIGAVVGRAEIVDSISASSISTFGGNPVATAGALAVLRYIRRHDLQGNARDQGARMRRRLDALAVEHDAIGEVRGKGLMQALELVHPDRSPDAAAAAAVQEASRRAGLLIGKGGLYGNVLRITPPLTVTADEVDAATSRLADAFATLI